MRIAPLAPELQKKLPSPQGVALAILKAFQNEDVSVAEISTLVQSDPALSGRLLEHANVAAMGARPVVSAAQAVNRLGLQTVRMLTLSFSLIDSYSTGACKGFDYDRFWSHSLLMGLVLREVGSLIKVGVADELFTAGLLIRVGCLAAATAYPSEYGKILATGAVGSKLIALEQKFLHLDHLYLSTALMVQWGIPEVFVQGVLFHEEPASSPSAVASRPWQMCRSMQLALSLADFALLPPQEQPARTPALVEMANQLGLDAKELGRCVDAIAQQWKTWGSKLNVQTIPIASFEEIAAKLVRPDQEVDASWLRVLIVEDDPIACQVVATWLSQACGYTVKVVSNGEEAMKLAFNFVPHVVVTDWYMPAMDGLALCRSLRASSWGKNMYIIMLTSADQESELVQAFDAGVDDYLSKPINLVALRARLKAAWRYVRLRDAWEKDNGRLSRLAAELALSNRRLQHAALTDPLTELSNRRAGLNALAQAWSSITRHEQPLTVITADIDHFKAVNDSHGHAVGDAMLQHIAGILRRSARTEDTVCRWGGEEFLIISPNVELGNGLIAAERLRQRIGASPLEWEGKKIAVTASFGVASWSKELKSVEELLHYCDEALYRSKAKGRNRVSEWTP